MIDNSSVIRRNIQKADDGSVFVCVATNEGGETSERVTVHVQGTIGRSLVQFDRHSSLS